ncbi:uncharacterized protein MELLADRAFT_62169 [Melampsora larici-populina 98AG31]|uniref:Uncharacterized protein n=1 Tax=Melampsora larici-populina (strain 98AG31 / pathotype 3-4-7) TaxID=747676 RepID=F4R652_MELLP|nr:uncharacterized protein MELLADRAFT_58845 [Melampsora larici-populina 98AG31]XP_007408653.1 uncharacterized protein MELLADRAFT_62169 [Melampsora larici-populina 98AG31]EGG07888.1 hypothetical protein MELLADRAFT_62169 [Melampsora larici-populina 98AG31]EGG12529.1 hypothetical protein MELLADRAFT_58845 [Melampsora larici-populina 98AG31]
MSSQPDVTISYNSDVSSIDSVVPVPSDVDSIPSHGLTPSPNSSSEIPSHGLTPSDSPMSSLNVSSSSSSPSPVEDNTEDSAPITSAGDKSDDDYHPIDTLGDVSPDTSSMLPLPPDQARWYYEPHSSVAPRDISSSISPNNIITTRRRANLASSARSFGR